MIFPDQVTNTTSSRRVIIVAVLTLGLGFIALFTYGLYPGNILYPWLLAVPVILAGIWFPRSAIIVTLVICAFLVGIPVFYNQAVPPGVILAVFFLLLIGAITWIISQRVRDLHKKEAFLMNSEPGTQGNVLADIGKNIDDARYCILPPVSVARLKMNNDLRGLIRALTREDVNVQYDAVEALGELPDPGSVSPLIAVLTRDRYSAVRWKAAESLAKIGSPSVPGLITTLGYPDEDVRWKAAIALGEIKDPRAIAPLVHLLGDKDNYVRGRVAFALGRIGQPAVATLVRTLQAEDRNYRWGAAIALGKIHDPRAIAPLIKALDDPDENVRSEALASLEHLENDIVDKFISLLNTAGDQELEELLDPYKKDSQEEKNGSKSIFTSIANADRDVRHRLQKAIREANDGDLAPLSHDLGNGEG